MLRGKLLSNVEERKVLTVLTPETSEIGMNRKLD